MQISEQKFIDNLSDRLFRIKVNERLDNGLTKMYSSGLVEEYDYSKFNKLINVLHEDGEMTSDMKKMTYDLIEKFVGFIVKDNSTFNMIIEHQENVKQTKIKEHNEYMRKQRIAFEKKYQIVEHDGIKHYVDENDQLLEYNDDAVLSFIERKKGAKNAKK